MYGVFGIYYGYVDLFFGNCFGDFVLGFVVWCKNWEFFVVCWLWFLVELYLVVWVVIGIVFGGNIE